MRRDARGVGGGSCGAGTSHASAVGMQIATEVTFRNLDHSDAAEAYVHEHVAKLESFDARLVGCRVAVELPHRHRRSAQPRVRIGMTVPGKEIVVDYEPSPDDPEEGVFAAVDQAFDRAARRLEDHVRRRRGDVKHHEPARREGRVVKLWTYEGFGFIEGDDGVEVYFHRNSVLNGGVARLAIGSKVRFVDEAGDRGPQASTVVVLKD